MPVPDMAYRPEGSSPLPPTSSTSHWPIALPPYATSVPDIRSTVREVSTGKSWQQTSVQDICSTIR
eukprot:472426-Rhodomonas_salina.1